MLLISNVLLSYLIPTPCLYIHFPKGAMINLGIFGGAVTCVHLFRSINISASNLMIPYALWAAFASVISVRVAMLNDDD
ncbi:uncharacterized protein DC041_0005296 [Schistosoma bovis]|uniref:Benzodiazapine receptor n=1 Tax=Schistosoma bovis TaxID=6184 RepID=A0A430QDW8_SCHBO|nr:uncharacterized protein DC041_0005296 [Schistosoma bovis]